MIFRFFRYMSYRRVFFQARSVCIGAMAAIIVFLFVPQILYASSVAKGSKSSSSLQKDIESGIEFDVESKDIVDDLAKESIFKRGYDAVSQFIENNEHIFTPISGATAGMVLCGSWCAALGGMFGAIDELSIYFGYTDRRYLTWGIFGATTGHVINPSLVPSVAGAIVGVLMPTGIFNEHQEFIAPAVSMIAGNSKGGTSGIIDSGAAGALDEILLDKGITDKHYLTFGTLGAAAVNLLGSSFGFNPAISNAIGVILGFIAASYEKEITDDLLAPIKTVDSLYTTYGKFMPKEQLDNHIERHAIVLFGGQFLTQFLSLKIMGYQQKLVYNFERLDNPAGLAWNNFGREITNFAVFIFPYAIGQVFSGNVDRYFDRKLHITLEEQVRSELFFGETALRLSHDKNNTVLIDNLKNDVSTIVNSGSSLVTSAISTAVGGAYGIGIIVVHSPNIFIYSALYNKAETFVAEYLANQRRAYREKISELDSKFVTTFKHDAENIRTITERDGIEVTKERLQQLSSDLRELEGEQRLWGMLNSLWWSIAGTIDSVLNYYLVGREVNVGRIPFADRNKVQIANWQMSSLLSWSGHQAQMISEIEQSLDRVIILEGKLHFLPEGTDRIDQINRVIGGKIGKGNQLILQDLEVGIGERVLVTVKDLKLDMGKTYAITGETGCGKTSLLSKIKGIRENEVFGRGYIYYPEVYTNEEIGTEERETKGKAPKIVVLSQQDYFPLDSSLYEIISYPDKAPSDLTWDDRKREEIDQLLKEIGLYAFGANPNHETIPAFGDIDINIGVNGIAKTGETTKDCMEGGKEAKETENRGKEGDEKYREDLDLDSKKDWHTYLSGGEKKKVMAVSVIIKKPDILILDEIFNGLDPASIIKVQQMLRKYLPNTLILSVDHHAEDNNHDGFYNNELHFYDGSIIPREMGKNSYRS